MAELCCIEIINRSIPCRALPRQQQGNRRVTLFGLGCRSLNMDDRIRQCKDFQSALCWSDQSDPACEYGGFEPKTATHRRAPAGIGVMIGLRYLACPKRRGHASVRRMLAIEHSESRQGQSPQMKISCRLAGPNGPCQ